MENGDMGEILDEMKDLVCEYYQQGRLAIFVGAGVSSLSDYPSWSSLVIRMANDIGYHIRLRDENGKEKLSSDEYLKIPQIYYEHKGEKEYYKIVRKMLHAKKDINDVHKLIMYLKPHHILTTNYDTLIEQAANSAGMSYSVINSDDKVSSAPTMSYILKVHGDFENNNFVLKEDDYLNYDNNFKLIDNLMKTIISTHLVIFVGYSLGDYNIKLVLNWVRQIQKEDFVSPIFIHTDPNILTDMELAYYRGERIRVLDANLCVTDIPNPTYKDRYMSALKTLLDSDRSEKWNRNDIWVVDHFYRLCEPLKDICYLRKKDVALLVPGSQIQNEIYLKSEDYKYLLGAYKRREKLSKTRKKQLELVINRIKDSGIEVVEDFTGNEGEELNGLIYRGFKINEDPFELTYQQIRERLANYSDSIEDMYSKAYDMFLLGELQESAAIYKELIPECYSKKRWMLYYLSQVNLYYIRQTMIQLNHIMSIHPAGVGKLWDDEKIEEMKLSHIVTDIPAELKKYDFLQRLNGKNYYQEDVVKLYEENYEIEKGIEKNQYTVAGMSKDQKAMIDIWDAVNFIYSNKIAFSQYSEHKKFVKIALRQRLIGMKHQQDTAKKAGGFYGKDENLDFQELLLLIRNFSYDDLEVFYEKSGGKTLSFIDENEKFDKYVSELITYFEKFFVGPLSNDEYVEYFTLKDEMRNSLLMASYYIDNDESIEKCLNSLLESYSDNEMDFRKNLALLDRFKNRMADPVVLKSLLERYVVTKIEACEKAVNQEVMLRYNKGCIAMGIDVIKDWFDGHIGDTVYSEIENCDDELKKELKTLIG